MSQHSIKSFSAALFKKSFYRAFINILFLFKSPLEVLVRYVFEVGNYPKKIYVRTPLGLQSATAFSHHDLITFVECFGKLDYGASENISVVVDFGSNIGLSALYFLTRNQNVKVYLFEPVPRNIDRLKKNLIGFEERYELKECAVGVEDGKFDFALDDTGRYGGLIKGGAPHFSQWDPQKIVSVDVVSANQYLVKILNLHQLVDILKIDVEGYENKILSNLKEENLSRVGCVYAETADNQKLSGFYSRSNSGLTTYYRIQTP